MSEVLAMIFLYVALIVLVGITILVFMQLYQIFEEPTIQKQMRTLRKPVQPWVTVLLYSRSNQLGIDASLKALLRSRYHNFDIVVIHDNSKDTTKALKKGYSKSNKGKIVISMQAGTIVHPSFLKRAVALKAERSQVIVRVNQPIRINSLTDIIHSLNNLLWQRSYKVRLSDASIISVIHAPRQFSFWTVLIFVGLVWVSVAMKEPIVLWYSWLIISTYLFAVTWLKEETIITKIQLTFSVFSAVFLLPVATVVLRLSQLHSRN